MLTRTRTGGETYPADTCRLVGLGLKQRRLKRLRLYRQIVLNDSSYFSSLRNPNAKLLRVYI